MSKQAKHTPGPWKVVEQTDPPIVSAITPRGELDIADVIAQADQDEDEANARLIAASPELLQACCVALADLEGYLAEWETDPALETVQELRAVIAKATGQD